MLCVLDLSVKNVYCLGNVVHVVTSQSCSR